MKKRETLKAALLLELEDRYNKAVEHLGQHLGDKDMIEDAACLDLLAKAYKYIKEEL